VHILNAKAVGVSVLERLDGIRNRLKASKRFNRMMASWAFRQLVNFVEYKAARYGIPVVFVDTRRARAPGAGTVPARTDRTSPASDVWPATTVATPTQWRPSTSLVEGLRPSAKGGLTPPGSRKRARLGIPIPGLME
jgi:IS605 OrfB family transposase